MNYTKRRIFTNFIENESYDMINPNYLSAQPPKVNKTKIKGQKDAFLIDERLLMVSI